MGRTVRENRCFYAYRDSRGWGDRLVARVRALGMPARLFRWAWQVPDRPGTTVYIRLNCTPMRKRNRMLRLAGRLAAKRHITLVPSRRGCELYDDKVKQAELFRDEMPPTWVCASRGEAEAALSHLTFPFVSKSREGAGSSNVRLIRNRAAADAELEQAFGGPGIPQYGGARQRGYLIWQHFVPDNAHDWRMMYFAKRYVYALKRFNRDDVPFASGSGKWEGILALGPESEPVVDFGLQFVRRYDLRLAALDVVVDTDGTYRLLESSGVWGWKGKVACPVFKATDTGWQQTDYDCPGMFDLMAHCIVHDEFADTGP